MKYYNHRRFHDTPGKIPPVKYAKLNSFGASPGKVKNNTFNEVLEKREGYNQNDKKTEIAMLLQIQLKKAKWWRDASLLYFQNFYDRPLPEGVEKSTKSLDYYKSLKFPFAPGIRPRWD